jgi:hypothetical protein
MVWLVQHTGAALGLLWWWLREVSADAAYENYLRRASGTPEVLSAEQFFLSRLKRKYSRVSRCC